MALRNLNLKRRSLLWRGIAGWWICANLNRGKVMKAKHDREIPQTSQSKRKAFLTIGKNFKIIIAVK